MPKGSKAYRQYSVNSRRKT